MKLPVYIILIITLSNPTIPIFARNFYPTPGVSAVETQNRIELSDQQAQEIGRRIWKNECEGTIEGLTSWNNGEDFPSLGIGHFIWYPERKTGPFAETFPSLLSYLQEQGIKLPRWLEKARGCPWPDQASFRKHFNSPQLKELRSILAATVSLQARFAAKRLEQALPKILTAAPEKDRERIKRRFYQVTAQPVGMYALMDYINFKGEGTSSTERYHGHGWGLLQVLQQMGEGPVMVQFSNAAADVLTRRVKNSPKTRNEAKWLPGWHKRCDSYSH